MRGNSLAEKKNECANDEGWIFVTQRRHCKAKSQREPSKEVTIEKMKKLLKTRGVKKNEHKLRVVVNHYQKRRSPVTLEEFLPSLFCTKISLCDTKASCCNIEKE